MEGFLILLIYVIFGGVFAVVTKNLKSGKRKENIFSSENWKSAVKGAGNLLNQISEEMTTSGKVDVDYTEEMWNSDLYTYKEEKASTPYAYDVKEEPKPVDTARSKEAGRVKPTILRKKEKEPEVTIDWNEIENGGITFRHLPAGQDEMAYLVKRNRIRERYLEKSLERGSR